MERLTSDDLRSSAAEKTISSNYYSYTRPSQNGYTSVAIIPPSTTLVDGTSDTESERVGVFDYVLSSSQHLNSRSLSSAACAEDDPGISRQNWAQDLNSLGNGGARCDSGTELTTFHCTGSSSDASQGMNDRSCGIGSVDVKADADNCSDLEEIIVHSEPQSQRASYERFNPDFPYSRVCSSSSSSAHEPATVFVTSVSKSSGSQGSSYAIDTSDERDVIERRSHHYTTLRKSAYIFTA